VGIKHNLSRTDTHTTHATLSAFSTVASYTTCAATWTSSAASREEMVWHVGQQH